MPKLTWFWRPRGSAGGDIVHRYLPRRSLGKQLRCLRKLSLSLHSQETGAIGSIMLDSLAKLEDVHLVSLIPSSIRLPPACQLRLKLLSSNVTWDLKKLVEGLKLTELFLVETHQKPLEKVLRLRLGKPGSLQRFMVQVAPHISEETIRVEGPLVQHCITLIIRSFSTVCILIPSFMNLTECFILTMCHPKMVEIENLRVLGESLRKLDMCLSKQRVDKSIIFNFKPGEPVRYEYWDVPAWCNQLLVAATSAERSLAIGSLIKSMEGRSQSSLD